MNATDRYQLRYYCAYCCVHEQQIGGPQGFYIDHFKPRTHSKMPDFAALSQFVLKAYHQWFCKPSAQNVTEADDLRLRFAFNFASKRKMGYGLFSDGVGFCEFCVAFFCG